jgi:hypothetical protein
MVPAESVAGDGDPLTVVIANPVPLKCERKDVCILKASPGTVFSPDRPYSRNNASTVSLADSIMERFDTGSASDRNRRNQPTLIINDNAACLKLSCLAMYARKPPTFGDDEVIVVQKYLRIPRCIPQTIRVIFMPRNERGWRKTQRPRSSRRSLRL